MRTNNIDKRTNCPHSHKKRKAIKRQLSFFIHLPDYCGYRICVARTSAEVNPFQGRTNEFITELGSEVGVPEMWMPEVWLVWWKPMV